MFPISDDNPRMLTPIVTWSIIGVCVLVFLWQVSLGEEVKLPKILCGEAQYSYAACTDLSHGGFSVQISSLRRSCLVGLLTINLCACAATSRVAFTLEEQAAAHIPGIPTGRFFADDPEDVSAFLHQAHGNPPTILALSGGGSDWAFGAGLLVGWSQLGTRPKFSIVSGVSAGALIAPFAFLGPEYDSVLQEVLTEGYASELSHMRVFASSSAADFPTGSFYTDLLRGLSTTA